MNEERNPEDGRFLPGRRKTGGRRPGTRNRAVEARKDAERRLRVQRKFFKALEAQAAANPSKARTPIERIVRRALQGAEEGSPRDREYIQRLLRDGTSASETSITLGMQELCDWIANTEMPSREEIKRTIGAAIADMVIESDTMDLFKELMQAMNQLLRLSNIFVAEDADKLCASALKAADDVLTDRSEDITLAFEARLQEAGLPLL